MALSSTLEHGTMNMLWASPNFYKAHGLGNDYLIFEEGEGWPVTAATVRALCDRQRGVGSDGIVLVEEKVGDGPLRLHGFNPDGSRFERSGNGLRIVAAFLASTGRTTVEEPFEIEIGGDRVGLTVHSRNTAGVYDISVAMGKAVTGPAAVRLDKSVLDEGGRLVLPSGEAVEAQFVSVGNPHTIVFVDSLLKEDLLRLGEGIALHPGFRNGTNVQLARVLDGGSLEVLIWERGVGPTLASGTSSCATAAAAVKTGRVQPGEIRVRMEGGDLLVHVTEELDITLRGPVEEVCEGRLSEGFLARLEG